jgi:copper oxidase (laccase) domain-containing protein
VRPHVDLRRIVREQLREAGLADEAIDDVAGCTKCDAARFFSFRRDREKSGRLLSAIVARSGSGGA